MTGDVELAERQRERLAPLLPPSVENDPRHPLFSLLGNSRFLVDYLVAHPAELGELVQTPRWSEVKDGSKMTQELGARFAKEFQGTVASAERIIRRYKYPELARIAIRDLAGLASFEETGRELSGLAEASIQTACRAAFHCLGLKQLESSYLILALGKLGGEDLNFSSDVDLLCVYGTRALQKQEALFEGYTKVSETVRKILNDRTEDGLGYRVDLDLRPEGRNGPLANSVEALEKYYEVAGASWERLALIKARVVAGDSRLGNECLAVLEPFVYPRTIDSSSIAEIKKMKEKINKEFKKKGGFHLKLGRGGIREIEFFTSAFQLVYGGKEPKLRETNTLKAIAALEDLKKVPVEDASLLHQAYLFLRRAENRLQMMDERQVHTLPTQPKELGALAQSLGFESSDRFLVELRRRTEGVADCFEKLASSGPQASKTPAAFYWNALNVDLAAESDTEERLEILRRFKTRQENSLKERDRGGQIPLAALFGELTGLAEGVLRGGYEISRQELLRQGRLPVGPFAVVAMGKFGGKELTYRSDLDMIFLFKCLEDQELYSRLVVRVISSLSLTMREGHAYKIDTALRPSGNAGTLVSTLAAFRDYHRESAWTWERQSLIKARPLLGEPDFVREVGEAIETIVYEKENKKELPLEIHQMRERMERELGQEKPGRYHLKTGRGGLVDIEFVVQYLQLLYGGTYPKVRRQNTLEALGALRQLDLVEESTAELLERAYFFYRELESRLRLVLERPTDLLVEGTKMEEEFFHGRSVVPRYLEMREEVRAVYRKILQV